MYCFKGGRNVDIRRYFKKIRLSVQQCLSLSLYMAICTAHIVKKSTEIDWKLWGNGLLVNTQWCIYGIFWSLYFKYLREWMSDITHTFIAAIFDIGVIGTIYTYSNNVKRYHMLEHTLLSTYSAWTTKIFWRNTSLL